MGTTDVKCPECGAMNYSLYLEETEGFIECTCCGCTVQLHRERASVLSGDKQIHFLACRKALFKEEEVE